MEIRHFRLVSTVAETQNLTRAAEKLFLSQSALSHQLREIETHYGTPVFTRAGRRMLPTPAGARLLRTARSVLDAVDACNLDMKRLLEGDTGMLRLSTACYTCYHWLPPLMKTFAGNYPGVEIQVIAEATRRPLDYLLDGKLDVAIVSNPQRTARFRLQKLFSDEQVVLVSPRHPWAKLPYISPARFAEETYVMYSLKDEESAFLRDMLKPKGIVPKQTLRVEITEAIVELVKANMGVTLLARWAVRPQLQRKELVAIPFGKKGLRRDWYAATLQQQQPAYIDDFIRHLAKELKKGV